MRRFTVHGNTERSGNAAHDAGMGELLADDPFLVLDDPVVPETAYYPIIDMWVYAFPVLLTIGSMMFMLRTKIEDEALMDISEGRFK